MKTKISFFIFGVCAITANYCLWAGSFQYGILWAFLGVYCSGYYAGETGFWVLVNKRLIKKGFCIVMQKLRH
jgi:hypothetical protein